MTARFGLSEQDIRQYQNAFTGFPEVEQVVIYGSRAKGNFRAASDIDLTLMGNISWERFTEMETCLDDLMLPYQIDLSIYNQIDNSDLIEHIQRVGQVFYSKA